MSASASSPSASSPDRRPVVISGPSGVGKSTLYQRLLANHPGVFATTVSHTTRKPRPGEVEGQTYYYVSKEEFQSLIAKDAFVEHAVFGGNNYGTSKQTIIDQAANGARVILDIEMEGVKQLKQEMAKPGSEIDARFVFIAPPSLEILEQRLRGRGTEDEDSVQKRLAQATAEIEYANTGVHDQIIVNNDLDEAYRELEEFIFNKK